MKNTQDTLLDFVLDPFIIFLRRGTGIAGLYPLGMLFFCTMAAFLTGKKSFYDMNTFAGVNKELLIELFDVSATPSHDTFTRIFRILDRKPFALCLQKFSGKIGDIMARHVVAIDEKTCRRARDAAGKAAHIISAWSLTPGGCMVEERSNTITLFRNVLIFREQR